jgi:hypothetical protein
MYLGKRVRTFKGWRKALPPRTSRPKTPKLSRFVKGPEVFSIQRELGADF